MKILGVDPGISGGLALIDKAKIVFSEDVDIVRLNGRKFFDPNRFHDQVRRVWSVNDIHHVVIEEPLVVHACARKSIATQWAIYGMMYGILLTVYPGITKTTPKEWQEIAYRNIPTDIIGKDRSKYAASAIFSDRKWTEGQADAALIAWSHLVKEVSCRKPTKE